MSRHRLLRRLVADGRRRPSHVQSIGADGVRSAGGGCSAPKTRRRRPWASSWCWASVKLRSSMPRTASRPSTAPCGYTRCRLTANRVAAQLARRQADGWRREVLREPPSHKSRPGGLPTRRDLSKRQRRARDWLSDRRSRPARCLTAVRYAPGRRGAPDSAFQGTRCEPGLARRRLRRAMPGRDGPGAGTGASFGSEALAEYWSEMAPRASAKVEASRNAARCSTARRRSCGPRG